MKQIRQRILNGETVFGTFLTIGSSMVTEIIGLAGFDWGLIDMEHGMSNEVGVLHDLQALEGTPCAGLVRVEIAARQRVHRVLDIGAEGVMFPRLTSAAEAREALDMIRYQPAGQRGVARGVRVTQYGANAKDYMTHYTERILGIIQIENESILNGLDEIAAMEGCDVLFVGPADLSMALGIFGQFDHPKFAEALERVAKAANKAGKAAGILMGSPDEFARYHALGYRFIGCATDMGFLHRTATTTATALKDQRAKA